MIQEYETMKSTCSNAAAMARHVHLMQRDIMCFGLLSLTLYASIALSTGCVFPQPLEETVDASGINTPPRVLNGNPVFGTLTFDRSISPQTKKLTLSPKVRIVEPDPQTLFIRVILDSEVNKFLPTSQDSFAPTPGDPYPEIEFSITGLCEDYVTDSDWHALRFYVSDTGFVNKGSDLRIQQAGGGRDDGVWVFKCVTEVPHDGGL